MSHWWNEPVPVVRQRLLGELTFGILLEIFPSPERDEVEDEKPNAQAQ